MSIRTYLRRTLPYAQSSVFLPHHLRLKFMRRMGAKIGVNVDINHGVYFGDVTKVDIGDDVGMASGTYVDGCAMVTLGERVRVGPNVTILTGTHDVMNSVFRRKLGNDLCLPVTIERGCWIGASSTILPGVTVKQGCVVAAGSVITKDTEANGLYVGVPAVRKKDLSVELDA